MRKRYAHAQSQEVRTLQPCIGWSASCKQQAGLQGCIKRVHPVGTRATGALTAAGSCAGSLCQQLGQAGVARRHLPQLLELQESVHMPAALPVHLKGTQNLLFLF